jgi:molecular chaperone GrpE
MTEHNLKPYVIGQKLALYDPETKKFLLLKANKPTGNEDPKKYATFWTTYFPWDLPGGRIENDETVAEGLQRDVVEEIGEAVQYSLEDIVHSEHMEYIDGPVYATFTLGLYQGGDITLSEEHSEYQWMTSDEVANHKDIKLWLKNTIANATLRIQERSYLDDLKRLQADFDNYKKRQSEAEKSLKEYLIQGIVLDIIPVLDNFNAATQHVPEAEKTSPWVVGISYIEKQLEAVLKEHGVTTIEPNIGDTFDPTKHEAIEKEAEAKEFAEGEEIKDIISKVHQKGYQLGDRVIRAAKVTIK